MIAQDGAMKIANPAGLSGHAASSRRLAGASDRRVSMATLRSVLLQVAFYASLWRATGMWYGLPANFAEDGGGSDPTPMRVLLYSLIPILALYALIDKDFVIRQFRSVSPLLLIVLVSILLSLLVSIDRSASVRGLLASILMILGPVLYRMKYGSIATFRILARFAIIAAFANLLYTLAFPQFAIMRGSYAGMVKGLFYHKNLLGQYSAIAFVILLGVGAADRRARRGITYRDLWRWAAMALFAGFILAARSSTAVVTLSMGVAVFYMLRFIGRLPGGYATRYVLIRMIWIAVAVLASFTVLGVAAMIAEAFGKDLTFSGRTEIWGQLIPLVAERPLLGYGFAMFRQPDVMMQYVRVGWEARSTHNTYLELALNIGLPGTIAWVVFVFGRLNWKMSVAAPSAAEQNIRYTEAVIILLILIGSLTEAGMMLAPLVLWPFMAISLCRDSGRVSSPPRRQKSILTRRQGL